METSGSLTATNAGTSLSDTGPTSLTNVNLYASVGGVLEFPMATSYVDTAAGHTIQANGMGSQIDLGHLATFDGGSSSVLPTRINARGGGTVVLAGAFSEWTSWTLSGAGSSFNVSGVTSPAGATLTAADGAVWVLPGGGSRRGAVGAV